MNIVIDANIIFSALIKIDGKIASVLTSPQSNHKFYSSNYLQLEIFKHKGKIVEVSKLNEPEFLEHSILY